MGAGAVGAGGLAIVPSGYYFSTHDNGYSETPAATGNVADAAGPRTAAFEVGHRAPGVGAATEPARARHLPRPDAGPLRICPRAARPLDQPETHGRGGLSELHADCQVFTLDTDFRRYRRHGRQVIPLLAPN